MSRKVKVYTVARIMKHKSREYTYNGKKYNIRKYSSIDFLWKFSAPKENVRSSPWRINLNIFTVYNTEKIQSKIIPAKLIKIVHRLKLLFARWISLSFCRWESARRLVIYAAPPGEFCAGAQCNTDNSIRVTPVRTVVCRSRRNHFRTKRNYTSVCRVRKRRRRQMRD